LDDDPERTPSPKASCTLASIVAENSDYNLPATNCRRFRRLQSPILATVSADSVTWICRGFVVPTSRTDRRVAQVTMLSTTSDLWTTQARRLACACLQVRRRCALCQWLV